MSHPSIGSLHIHTSFSPTATASRAGFDVILGNPPYDVLSDREIGQNIDHLKRFIELDPALQPSRIGKNNLYKVLVARAVELLAEGGYLSFIVPMPLLGDEQARGIRRMLLSAGEFSETHAFPQKDNLARRVFRDAKLSTALFVYRKLRPELPDRRPLQISRPSGSVHRTGFALADAQ